MGFRCKGHPEIILDKVSTYLYRESLEDFIPIIRIERRSGPLSKMGGEFYLFLAIESDQPGLIPKPVKEKLLPLPEFERPAAKRGKFFSIEEIGSMVGKSEYSVREYGSRIPYSPTIRHTQLPADPLNLDVDPTDSSQQSETQRDCSKTHDKFLYWLSAQGSGSWPSFGKTSEILGLEEPRRILRQLVLLGHLETSSDGKRWSIAPAVASFQQDGYLLFGQRSALTLLKLEQAGHEVMRTKQPGGNAPTAIRLPATLIQHDITSLGWTCVEDASWHLAEILPDLSGWKQSLEVISGLVPSLYQWKQWQKHSFTDCSIPRDTGLYEMYRETGERLKTLFFDAATDTWRQGDWYGLRFLSLQEGQQPCSALYFPRSQTLWIARSQRWPGIYERALVLASGLLPRPSREGLIYSAISEQLAKTLTHKLSVNLEIHDA
jgi:hypothetical protein